MVTQNLAILSQKENNSKKISTTVDNIIKLKPDKNLLNTLRKRMEKEPTKAGITKLENIDKIVKLN